MALFDGCVSNDFGNQSLSIVAHPAGVWGIHSYHCRINKLGMLQYQFPKRPQRLSACSSYNRWIGGGGTTHGSDHAKLPVRAAAARADDSGGGVRTALVPGAPALRGALPSAR